MTPKPQQASDYDGAFTALVRAACLTIATRLGDRTIDLLAFGEDFARHGIDGAHAHVAQSFVHAQHGIGVLAGIAIERQDEV